MAEYAIGDKYRVYVTHIDDPHNFYVRRCLVDKIIQEMEIPGDRVDTVSGGDLIVYKCCELNKHIRGKICFISEDMTKCDIFAVDYGFVSQSVNICDIFKASDDSPPMAIFCRLFKCDPIGGSFSTESINAMRSFTAGEPAMITVKAIDRFSGRLTVELANSRHDVAIIMALANYSVLMEKVPAVRKKEQNSNNYPIKQLNEGDILHVRVLSGKDLSAFYVAEISDYENYKSYQQEFTNYCRSLPTVKGVDIGQKVGVFQRTEWPWLCERGIVKAILPGNRAKVFLVDLGIEDIVHFSFMRSIVPSGQMLAPAVAIYCATNKYQGWDTPRGTVLTPEYEFKIKIVEIGDSEIPHAVDLIRLSNN